MNVSFYLKGSTVSSVDRHYEGVDITFVRFTERNGGGEVTLVVGASDAAEMLAIGDTIRAAALKHLPAPEPALPVEV